MSAKKKVMELFHDKEVELAEGDVVVRIVTTPGGELFVIEGETEPGCESPSNLGLARMPSRFKNTIWIKNGTYVVVNEATDVTDTAGKIAFLIARVLSPQQVEYLAQRGGIPACLMTPQLRALGPAKAAAATVDAAGDRILHAHEGEASEDEFAGGNPNRRKYVAPSSSEEEEESEDDEEEEDDDA